MSLLNALTALARDNRQLDWDAWHPLARSVSIDPQSLVDAVGQLGDEDQYAVLDHLRADGGPLADYLLVSLASRPEVFNDEQVRAYALVDSTDALERRQAQLGELVEGLRAMTEQLIERRSSGFDLAQEVAALEARRNTLRAEQLESGHQEMSELEWEIARLELLRSRLEGYDAAQRRSRRDELRVETELMQVQRRTVEDEVAAALASLDEAHALLTQAEHEHAKAAAALSTVRQEHATVAASIEPLRLEIVELEASTSVATQRVADLQEQRRSLRGRLDAERARLEQLLSSPAATEAQPLLQKVRALYQQLPRDEADSMFTTNPRRGR